jgi:hypothetical protein
MKGNPAEIVTRVGVGTIDFVVEVKEDSEAFRMCWTPILS